MHPYHFLFLFKLCNGACKLTIYELIFLPVFLLAQVIFKVIESFEIVEKRSKHCFMKIEELLNSFCIEKYWNASKRL